MNQTNKQLPKILAIRICENEEALCNGTPYNRHYETCPGCKEKLSMSFQETDPFVIKQVVIYDLTKRLKLTDLSTSYRRITQQRLNHLLKS